MRSETWTQVFLSQVALDESLILSVSVSPSEKWDNNLIFKSFYED